MSSMPVEILPIAQEDVNQALLYISADHPLAADHLLESMLQTLRQIGEQPESGAVIVIGKKAPRLYRRVYVAPYWIYYRIMENRVIVLRVLHERMNTHKHL